MFLLLTSSVWCDLICSRDVTIVRIAVLNSFAMHFAHCPQPVHCSEVKMRSSFIVTEFCCREIDKRVDQKCPGSNYRLSLVDLLLKGRLLNFRRVGFIDFQPQSYRLSMVEPPPLKVRCTIQKCDWKIPHTVQEAKRFPKVVSVHMSAGCIWNFSMLLCGLLYIHRPQSVVYLHSRQVLLQHNT